ncbi:MAG: myo-inosose-2 dehydratase [Gammaproteobacteria bacterium]|nr:myo-inosose-2 dehydratase [Gammaproteobacteria bacterium]
MAIRIGINPLTWTNDDLPALGADIPLEVCLREARTAGYAGVELGRKLPREPEVLGPLLRSHGLDLVSGWYSTRLLDRDADAEFAAMADHFRLLKALGCAVCVVAEVTGCVHGDLRARQSSRPTLAAGEWPAFGARLTSLAEHMRDAGLGLAYHHHMGTVVQSAVDVDALMAHTGEAVGLLLDTGHLTFGGADPVAVARRHGQRVVHLHCKDVRPAVLARSRNRDTSFLAAVLDGVFTVPGDGCVDYPAVLGALAAAGYSGWCVVEAEQDPTVATPARYARLGYDYLAREVAIAFG